MTQPIHPSTIGQYLSTGYRANFASWGLLTLSSCLIAGGSLAKSPDAKTACFAGAVMTTAIARPIRQIAIASEQFYDDATDISLTSWQNWLYSRMKPESDVTLAPTPTEESEPLPLFDWAELADADSHPILAIVAPMGGGKSRIARFLAKHVLFAGQSPQIDVWDIYGNESEWKGCNLVVEHSEMLEQMPLDLEEIDDRIKAYRKGQRDFQGKFIILEEGADTIASLRAKNKPAERLTDEWLSKFTTVTRKVKGRLCIVSVKMSGAAIGVGAESRDDATIIFAGAPGVAKAMKDTQMLKLGTKQNKDLREQLKVSLQGVKRPALIYHQGEWYPAAVPNLDEQGTPIGQPFSSVAPGEEVGGQDDLETNAVDLPLTHCNANENQGSANFSPEISPNLKAQNTDFSRFSKGEQTGEENEFSLSDETLRDLIIAYQEIGIVGQDAFIEAHWQIVKSGKSIRYEQARERYQQVAHLFGL